MRILSFSVALAAMASLVFAGPCKPARPSSVSSVASSSASASASAVSSASVSASPSASASPAPVPLAAFYLIAQSTNPAVDGQQLLNNGDDGLFEFAPTDATYTQEAFTLDPYGNYLMITGDLLYAAYAFDSSTLRPLDPFRIAIGIPQSTPLVCSPVFAAGATLSCHPDGMESSTVFYVQDSATENIQISMADPSNLPAGTSPVTFIVQPAI